MWNKRLQTFIEIIFRNFWKGVFVPETCFCQRGSSNQGRRTHHLCPPCATFHSTTDALSAACSLHQFTHTHTICWPKITHKHHPNNNPVSQTDLKNSYLAHSLQIKHTGYSSLLLLVSRNTSYEEPLFWEIADLHKGGCVLTWTTTQKVSAWRHHDVSTTSRDSALKSCLF